MYTISKEKKRDPLKRWNLPDRVFFAAGACHILAYAFLEQYSNRGYKALWIRPNEGFRGNHIIATNGKLVFDYHGLTTWDKFFEHVERRANQKWPGWGFSLVELPSDVLISEEKSKGFDGLWLRGPEQYLHNALPRAINYLERFGELSLLI